MCVHACTYINEYMYSWVGQWRRGYTKTCVCVCMCKYEWVHILTLMSTYLTFLQGVGQWRGGHAMAAAEIQAWQGTRARMFSVFFVLAHGGSAVSIPYIRIHTHTHMLHAKSFVSAFSDADKHVFSDADKHVFSDADKHVFSDADKDVFFWYGQKHVFTDHRMLFEEYAELCVCIWLICWMLWWCLRSMTNDVFVYQKHAS